MNGPSGWSASDAAREVFSGAIAMEVGMGTHDQPGNGWTVVLRRQPAGLGTMSDAG
jgi:hypothetical protein